MTILNGTRLGSYEVLSAIGAGGMGEVYQAHDSKLGRDVAIKVLPEQFARDPERFARFQREAKMLAALNHPNIAAIYGLEQSGSTHYLVMELVPGETLRERVAEERPVPVDEALIIAKQIAEALEAAHENTIIHRDLKPANVKVTPEGRVKVLDFGLAKAFTTEASSEDVGNSPTLSMAATVQGVIMGTAAYMSPEQAKGKHVNKATDIFAFGAVLYELLTGKQAFQGDDVGDILAAVVKTDPDWSLLPEGTPPAIQRLLRRCLRKDKRQRLQDATDARIEIEDALAGPATPVPQTVAPAKATPRRVAVAVGIIALALGVVLGAWYRRPTAEITQGVVRLMLPLASAIDLRDVAISPDGTQVVYVAPHGGVQLLFLRPMNGLEAIPIPGTEGATLPFFSPDGQWLGFGAGGKIKKISTSGGVVVTLADLGTAGNQGGSWGPDGLIVFRGSESLFQISAAGGVPREITKPGPTGKEAYPQYPEFLPGGKAVLFTSQSSDVAIADERSIEVLTIETGERKVLVQGGSFARYLSTGHLAFMRSGTLMAAPFDLARLEVTGPPVAVLEGVRESVTGIGAFSCSRTGTCIYVTGGMAGAQRSVALVDRTGTSQPLAMPPQAYSTPRYSPQGDRLSFWVEQVNCKVVSYDISRGTLTRLTSDGDSHSPVWTPDGKRITYLSRKAATPAYEIFWKPSDGSGSEEKLSPSPLSLRQSPLSWSPDGNVVAFTDQGDIWLLTLMGDRKPRPFFQSKFIESSPTFSPDGRWLAYVSDESGRREVYVQPFPGPGAKYPISSEGATEPAWARNGRELFFRNGEKMMAVAVASQSGFRAEKPRLLFTGPYVQAATRVNYDVSPDGQRFVMLQPGQQEQAVSQIIVIQNWFEELKRRVPTVTK
jgi:Tol biopolymer transport system component/tRNA A-37 threonylcarbamoyl transferase component Bud32